MKWLNLSKYLAFALLLASWSLGQLVRWPLFGVAVYAHDIILLIWAGYLVCQYPWHLLDWQKLRHPLLIASSGLILVGWLVAAWQGNMSVTGPAYLFRLLFYLGCWWLIVQTSNIQRSKLMLGLVLSGLIMTGLGLLQYILVPDTRFLYILGWDDHYYRLIGSLFDPNFTGAVMALTFFYAALMLPPRWASFVQAILIVALTLTYSRSSYLALLIGLSLWLVLKPSTWKKHALLLTLALATYFIAPKPGGEGVKLLRTNSVTARIEASQQTVSDFEYRTLLIGEGLFVPQRDSVATEQFQRTNTARQADNLFLLIYNGTGILGLALFSWLLLKLFFYTWKNNRLLLVPLLVILVHAQFNNTLFQPHLWLLLSGGYLAGIQLNSKV